MRGEPLRWFPSRKQARCFARPVRRTAYVSTPASRRGSEVSPYYDSMVAKVIADGRDRAEAAPRLACALEDEPLLGFPTNQQFLAQLLRSREFHDHRLPQTRWMPGLRRKLPSLSVPRPRKKFGRSPPHFTRIAEAWANGSGPERVRFLARSRLRRRRQEDSLQTVARRKIAVSFDGGAAEITLIDARLPDIVFEASGVRRRAIALWDGAALHLSAGGFALLSFAKPSLTPRIMLPMGRGSPRLWLALS